MNLHHIRGFGGAAPEGVPDRLGPWQPRPVDASMGPVVVVVLGGRVLADGILAAATERRVQRARRAHQDGHAQRFVLSGGRRWGSLSEAEAMRDWLCQLGVPGDSIELELCSLSTLENAIFTARLLLPRGVHRIGLVTCDFHMARARHHFERAGMEVHPLPAPSRARGVLARTWRELHELGSLGFDRLRDTSSRVGFTP